MSIPNKPAQVARVRSLIAGANKHLQNVTVTLAGVSYALPALVGLLQSFVDGVDRVSVAKAAYQGAVKDDKAKAPGLLAVIRALRVYVHVTFANSPQALADFGIAPPKVPIPKTLEEKAVAAAKRAATRKARNVMGKNQRKKVKGALPATPPAAPSPAPTGGK
jgi:hypothetical protein